MNNSNVALYIRVSTEEQLKGFSIEGQLDELRSHCKKLQLNIYKEYIDPGLSGGSIKGRPALNELLGDAPKGKFHTVICWKINRLSRNLNDLLNMLNLFKNHNITFKSVTEEFNADTPMGQFVIQMMGSVAELERKQISQNTRLGMLKRNSLGKWNCGNTVLGYDWIIEANNHLSHVIINVNEASLVRNIFEQYASGFGFKAITNQLNHNNILTKRGKPFGIAAIKGILKNVNYIGYIRYGENVLVKSNHVPIISQGLWECVQSLQADRTSPPSRSIKRDHPLSGLLKCPQCEHSMIPAHVNTVRKNGNRKIYYYYACENHSNKGGSICKSNLIPADAIEQWFANQLEQLVSHPNVVDRIYDNITRKHKAELKPQQEELKSLNAELALLDSKQIQNYLSYEDGLISKDTFIEKSIQFNALRKVCHGTLGHFESNFESNRAEMIPIKTIKTALSQLWSVLNNSNAKQKKQLLKLLVEKIVVPIDRNIENAIIHTQAALMHIQFPAKTEFKENPL